MVVHSSRSELWPEPESKDGTAVFGATPLAAKFIAVALLGRPTINYLKNHPLKLSVKQQDSRSIERAMHALVCVTLRDY